MGTTPRWTSADLEVTAPELVVEVLSPGSANERRDRDVKLKLYSRRGVNEYWIVDWPQRKIELSKKDREMGRVSAGEGEHDM